MPAKLLKTVYFNSKIKKLFFLFAVKPEMANSPLTKKAAVNNGANAQLYCKAKGSPLPHFSWLFNGKTILPNVTDYKYSVTYTNVSIPTLKNQNMGCTVLHKSFYRSQLSELYSQSVLMVYHVGQSDYGKYECQAHNSVGHASESIALDVTSPPDEPSDLEAVNVTHDSVILVWKRGFDGGLPTSHQIRWREARDDEANYRYLDVSPGNYRAVVEHLALGTYYVFSIRAKNSKGESPFLPDLLKVQTLRE